MGMKTEINVRSEIGELEAVVLHTPGKEVENMTPQNAERALYSDILNLSVATREYRQLSNVLGKLTKTFFVNDLLTDILKDEIVRDKLLGKICTLENSMEMYNYLMALDAKELARQLIEGVVMVKNTLTKFMDRNRYSLRPLHNFFFMRDASMAVRDDILIGKMANKVRDREANIMEAIFDNHPEFITKTVNPADASNFSEHVSIEGGDVLVVRDDILLIGTGLRTSTQGIDYILEQLLKNKEKRHIIVQELPPAPESFIHLDMAFTMLDVDKCMVFEPLILKPNKYQTVQITLDNGKVASIKNVENIPSVLNELGMDLKPLLCGGNSDTWVQEREQWHSGANFFALGPGRVIGYGRNKNTIEQLNKNGFEVLRAQEIIDGKINPEYHDKYVITISGSELARGGGGCRCMTMPIRRKKVNWK